MVYKTGYYKAESRNFYSNFLDVSFYRITYTQSINGIEPSHLFYQSPNEADFDKQFLKSLDQNLMGFCFKDCFNYKQSGILIKPTYATSPDLLNLIKNTWMNANQIGSNLLNSNNIELSYITNKRSFKSMDTQTGLSIVLFNVKLNSKFNQIDSLDLIEPSKEDYLKELASVYQNITPKDFYPILDLSVIKEKLVSTTQQPEPTTEQSKPTNAQIKTTSASKNDEQDLPKEQSANTEWWVIFLIVLSVLIILMLIAVVTIVCIVFRNKNSKFSSKKHLLRSDNDSEYSSRGIENPFPRDFDENEDLDYTRSVINPNISIQEPNFNQTISKGVISRQSDRIVYPGLTIEELVPNPIYTKVKTDENLVSNVYVTGNMKEMTASPSSQD